MTILIPAWLEENLERGRFVDEQIMLGLFWTEVVRDFDERASFVFISENAHAIAVEDGVTYKVEIPGIVPGRWHIRVKNDPPFAHTYMPVTTPEGGYREPDTAAVEEFKRRSIQNKTVDQIIAERRAEEAKGVRARELVREQLKDEAAVHIRAALRVAGDGGMTKRRWGMDAPNRIKKMRRELR